MFVATNQEIVCHYQQAPSQEISDARAQIAERSYHNGDVLRMFDRLMSAVDDEGRFLDAVLFAAQKHQSQVRKDEAHTPYIIHPMGVALSLWEEGLVRDPDTLIAALLHDTLEDTDATYEELADRFGAEVAGIVLQLTNPPGLAAQESKAWQVEHAPSMCMQAKLIKLADRLYNIRDLKPAPIGWSEEKVEGYYHWGQKLLNVLKGSNPRLEELLQEAIDSR